jgi:hypothetical protein
MFSRSNRAYLRASGRISRLAMAKVEGSNPFIRFQQKSGAKLAVLPGRGSEAPSMSLTRTFTARAKARACRLQLLTPCEAGSGAAFVQAAKISAVAKTNPQTERVTG